MHHPASSLLRNTLRADAIFCALAGVDLVLFSRSVAGLLAPGVVSTTPSARLFSAPGTALGLAWLGVGLLGYAAYLLVASRREPLSFTEAWTFVAADFVWIAGSALVIALGPLSTTGKWIVGIAAVAVLALAEGKMFGIKRLRRGGATLALGHEAG